MAANIKVMIVDDIAETREQLRKLLSFDPDIAVVAMVGSGEDAVSSVLDARPDVILMDINLPGIDGITATGKVVEVLPTVQVIMLSVQGESDYMRRAMMAGARDYLTKPPSADDLLDAIHRAYKLRQKMGTGPLGAQAGAASAVAEQAKPATYAKIITFYSPKGGTGCTTLAVNLAVSLQKILGADSKVCLIDGNLQFGDVTNFMKLKPTRTSSDLAPHAGDLDPDLLRTILTPHSSGVSVLAGPATPEDAEVFKEGGIDDNSGANLHFKGILEFVQSQFDYVIVDTAHQVDDIVLALLDLSDLFLLVTRPILPQVIGASNFLGLLRRLEYPLENLALVVNGVDKRLMELQPEHFEHRLIPAIARIPLDDRTVLRSANHGEPFILSKNARSVPIGQAMVKFAESVHTRFTEKMEEEVVEPQQQKRSGLGRLL